MNITCTLAVWLAVLTQQPDPTKLTLRGFIQWPDGDYHLYLYAEKRRWCLDFADGKVADHVRDVIRASIANGDGCNTGDVTVVGSEGENGLVTVRRLFWEHRAWSNR